MTVVQYVEYVIKHNWEPMVDGRRNPVPEPPVYRPKEVKDGRIRSEDAMIVRDGGPFDYEPATIGWTAENTTGRVSVEVRTSHSRERFEGARDDQNSAEAYGGLAGELKRIFDLKRSGDKEWDLIDGYQFNDNSGRFGSKYWRGTFELRLEQKAALIEPPEP